MMKQIVLVGGLLTGLLVLMAGCSAPKPPQPSGDWVPVNPSITGAGALK